MPMPIDDDNFSIAVAQVEQASLAAVAASTISNDKRVAMSEQRFTKARSSNRSNQSRRLGLIFASLWLMLLLQLAKETEGYRAIIPIDEANPGKCIYRGDLLQEGVNNGIPPCQRLTCNADGSILIEGCGKLRIDKCNRGERIYPSKPFPECCKLRYKCKQPGEAPFYIERNAAEGA